MICLSGKRNTVSSEQMAGATQKATDKVKIAEVRKPTGSPSISLESTQVVSDGLKFLIGQIAQKAHAAFVGVDCRADGGRIFAVQYFVDVRGRIAAVATGAIVVV